MLRSFFWIFGVTVVACHAKGEECTMEHDIAELIEMVPFERIMSLAMEYAIADPQVKALLGYLSGPKFRGNMVALEASPQFSKIAEAAGFYQIDAYSVANKFNTALDMPPVKYEVDCSRRKRSPGNGIVSFIKEALQIVSLAEIKEAYKRKLECNPKLKNLMSRLLSEEGTVFFQPILESSPLLETRRDLEELGIPTREILNFLQVKADEFFDLNSADHQSTDVFSE